MKKTIRIGDVDLYQTLKPLAFFPSDPTTDLTRNRFARASSTPDGPAVVEVRWGDGTGIAAGSATIALWGDGASWIDDRLESLLGLADDVSAFEPADNLVTKLWRRFPGLRITASHTLWHDVAWLIPGQRVASADAAAQWAALTRKFADPAPGPLELLLPPSAAVLAATHYTEFHDCGIERRRAENLRHAARYIPRLENSTDESAVELRRKLELIPGFGPWTATNVLTMTAGHVDEVVLGDYGLPSFVSWALAGERVGTDKRMLELLEPFRPHRWRVCRLIMSSGIRPARHGPRVRNPRIHRM